MVVFAFSTALSSLAMAGSPGLPLTEDFNTTTLRDDELTSADWSTEEQAVFLAWSQQRQLPRYSLSDLGSETDSTNSVVLGDIDRDGDLDLVVGDSGQTNKLYRTVNFLSTGTVVSTTVNTGENISSIVLTATAAINTATTRHTGIDYFVSNDGGNTWYRTYSGAGFTFPQTGNDLRWKAELRTLSTARSPILQQVTIKLDAIFCNGFEDISLCD